MFAVKSILAVTVFCTLTACGGGGGGSGTPVSTGPIASTNAFNLQSGFTALVSAGYSKTFTLTGSCAGSLSITEGPATTATTFEGNTAISSTRSTTMTLANCTPASASATSIQYYDSNYMPKGSQVQGGDYAVYTAPLTISTAAKVGDVVVVGTANLYTSSAKTTSTGRVDETYVMEADTATTAIINFIDKTYDSSNTLLSTEQDRYRVAANGSLTPLSVDVQLTSGLHIVGN
jgi:hypothetical protein